MADMGAGQISGTLDFVDLRHSHAEVFSSWWYIRGGLRSCGRREIAELGPSRAVAAQLRWNISARYLERRAKGWG